jgi:microcystin-dependent protein
MSCSNCYNGCTQITSDQCVKYTGIEIPVLGIKTGDSLSYVEQAIIEFLVSTLDGTGIKIDISPSILCSLVSGYLPTCKDITAVDLFNALIQSVCSLQTQLNTTNTNLSELTTTVDAIDAPYTIPNCLTGLTSTSTTHEVLQKMITSFCQFVQDAGVTYVKLTELDTLIGQYLQSQQTSDKYYTKMVPHVAMEFYPTSSILNNFDDNGIGVVGSAWEKIYLCNGLNGTPDKRGVVAIGVTDGTMKGGQMNNLVNPSISGNPNYIANGTIFGTNTIQLSTGNMPSHAHTASAISTVTDPGHTHNLVSGYFAGGDGRGTSVGTSGEDVFNWDVKLGDNVVANKQTGITVATTVTVNESGGNTPHNNYQPAIGCYYIMYIPS